ncbi:hypothetical protein J8TS2_42400 [Lederbergia ruris]|uniref:Helix-turn-helix domain-containing protein n=1 Tax=Lederbergia ruris TaxID=217495 RepID=A0ABQ4KQZ7_9BACI|nr:hypothetical protein [Lederbergia ruris]GIN59921.1 hypothetical protein J8TS2_42400 [Lederbergia ruris]
MHSDHKNEPKPNFDFEFIDIQTVADYYEVNCETVKKWIMENRISGKQLVSGKYLVSKQEFEYLKTKRDQDNTEKDIRQLLGDDYSDDWEVELD